VGREQGDHNGDQKEEEEFVVKRVEIGLSLSSRTKESEASDTCQRDQNISSISGDPALMYRMVGKVALDRRYGRTI